MSDERTQQLEDEMVTREFFKSCEKMLAELCESADQRNQIELAKLAEMRAARALNGARLILDHAPINDGLMRGIQQYDEAADRLTAAALGEPTNE